MNEKILESLIKLQDYIIKEDFRGYDPYDGLMSPIFKSPFLRSNKLIRFGFQQIFRRIPFNIRPLLGIKKGLNPVTLGLSIQAFTYLSQVFENKKEFYLEKINYCLERLLKLQSKGYSGVCWGYDFDWEARYTRIDAYQPTIVATGIITNALYEYYKFFNDENVKKVIISASDFVLNDLNRTYDKDGDYCLSYSPNDKQIVFNASMKGARLLAQAYSLNNNPELFNQAKKIVSFTIKYQNNDGSWPYSYGDARTWVDNFHTAYVLDCLDDYINISGDNSYEKNLQLGLNFYLKYFFENDGIAKYYSNKTYPIDSTAIAQSVLTLCRFGELKKAEEILIWTIKNMASKKGFFYYQRSRFYKHRTTYMRWSNAYMLVSLSCYLIVTKNYA